MLFVGLNRISRMVILVLVLIIFCSDLHFHVALLFSGLLVHGYVPEPTFCNVVIPIFKGMQCNITNSDNYRGIASSSIFGKVFDLILLRRYCDNLTSCDLQFGFK